MWALLGVAGIAEIAGMAAIAATLNGSGREPGDFAFDGGFAKDPAKLERFKLSEIKHSRECPPAWCLPRLAATDDVRGRPPGPATPRPT
jgi:hypothetical protein